MSVQDFGKPDPLILGHSQFFGINHMSVERALSRELQFSDIERIMAVIRYAYQKGARGMMLSTHMRAAEVAEAIAADDELRENLNIYILLPYMAKYVRVANQKGVFSMVSEMLGATKWSERFQMAMNTGGGLLKMDELSILDTLIELELVPYRKLKLRAVFLHNGLTDLIAALGIQEVLQYFHETIPAKFGAEGAFCTLSSYHVQKTLEEAGIRNPLIMAPFNPVGFQMSPDRARCEETLRQIPSKMIAMSTMAAGYVTPGDAAKYVLSLPEIDAAIVGASTAKHIDETFRCFEGIGAAR